MPTVLSAQVVLKLWLTVSWHPRDRQLLNRFWAQWPWWKLRDFLDPVAPHVFELLLARPTVLKHFCDTRRSRVSTTPFSQPGPSPSSILRVVLAHYRSGSSGGVCRKHRVQHYLSTDLCRVGDDFCRNLCCSPVLGTGKDIQHHAARVALLSWLPDQLWHREHILKIVLEVLETPLCSIVGTTRIVVETRHVRSVFPEAAQLRYHVKCFIEMWIYWLMDVRTVLICERLKGWSHQDVSVMRALSTKTTLTTGQAVQRAGRCAEKNKQERIGVKHCTTWTSRIPVRSSALAQLGFPRCSVSSWQSHDKQAALCARVSAQRWSPSVNSLTPQRRFQGDLIHRWHHEGRDSKCITGFTRIAITRSSTKRRTSVLDSKAETQSTCCGQITILVWDLHIAHVQNWPKTCWAQNCVDATRQLWQRTKQKKRKQQWNCRKIRVDFLQMW